MKTYEVELENGKVITRNSKKIFTNAIVAYVFYKNEFKGIQVWAYASSLSLAEKRLATFAKTIAKNGYSETILNIVEVRVAA